VALVASVPRNSAPCAAKAQSPDLFALFRRDSTGREHFVTWCPRQDLARWSGWPSVRAVACPRDQVVLP
jgi:hypothetical protein